MSQSDRLSPSTRSTCTADFGDTEGFADKGRQSRAGKPVIVVDASALLEVLLNTPAGTQLAQRFFRNR